MLWIMFAVTMLDIALLLVLNISLIRRVKAAEKEISIQHEWMVEATKHILAFGEAK